MPSLDDLLSAAIAEGKTALAEKKSKARVPVAQKRADLAKLLSVETKASVAPVHKGTFEITCIVAEYVRRTCKHCNHTELCSVPRVFICEQQVGVPSTRRLHRLHSQEVVLSYIQRGLPVKTEVYSSPAPFCRHCIKEILDATRQTAKGSDSDPAIHSDGAVSTALLPLPGAVSIEIATQFQALSPECLYNLPDSQGSTSAEELPPGNVGN
jgi:hypothetical protein